MPIDGAASLFAHHVAHQVLNEISHLTGSPSKFECLLITIIYTRNLILSMILIDLHPITDINVFNIRDRLSFYEVAHICC
jgi:hypothetical protein